MARCVKLPRCGVFSVGRRLAERVFRRAPDTRADSARGLRSSDEGRDRGEQDRSNGSGAGEGAARARGLRDPARHRRAGPSAGAPAGALPRWWPLLLEGVPGLAKTLTIKTLARPLEARSAASSSPRPRPVRSCWDARLQRQRTGDSPPGRPVFVNLLLADEINRAPAKVQSALLEVMQERQVTLGRRPTLSPTVPGPGHPEPDRVGWHLPAPRGPGRPLHVQGPG